MPSSEHSPPSAVSTRSIVSVGADEAGLRLDRFLASHIDQLSRVRIQGLIKAGAVSGKAGTVLDGGMRVKPGDTFELELPAPVAAEPAAEAIALAVVHEDGHVIVIDKPAGLVVHPAAGHATGTLVNALIAHCGETLSGIGGVKRPGIVHRLDKDTSGLIVVAKTDLAHHGLAEQFAAHGVDGRLTRSYLALAWGVLPHPRGRIDAALARSGTNRTKITVTAGEAGRHAVTHYETVEVFKSADGKPVASLVACRLETGRTHQIRVHLAHAGHPVLGDRTYGAHFAASARRLSPAAQAALETLGRQALHAAHLGFVHPATGRALAFDSALPADLAALVAALRAG